MDAYVLSDRGTWISFKNRGDLAIVVEGDKRLFNQYGVMLVNPEKHPHVKKELGQAFVDWLISPEGQTAIAGYKIDGQQLFFPNAEKKGRERGGLPYTSPSSRRRPRSATTGIRDAHRSLPVHPKRRVHGVWVPALAATTGGW